MELTRFERQVNYIGYSRNKNWGTFLEKPSIGIGSESDCLLGQLDNIFEISDSVAGLKVENWEGVTGEEGVWGHRAEETVARERRSLSIFSVNKQNCQQEKQMM